MAAYDPLCRFLAMEMKNLQQQLRARDIEVQLLTEAWEVQHGRMLEQQETLERLRVDRDLFYGQYQAAIDGIRSYFQFYATANDIEVLRDVFDPVDLNHHTEVWADLEDLLPDPDDDPSGDYIIDLTGGSEYDSDATVYDPI